MEINLSNQSSLKINLASRQIKDFFNSYKDKYKKAHTQSLVTGLGLTPDDWKNKIETIEKKLDSMCPHYQAMKYLKGNKAFVNPLYKVDAQRDVETTNSSDFEDENSESSNKSDDSDNLSIHAKMKRQRDSHQSVG